MPTMENERPNIHEHHKGLQKKKVILAKRCCRCWKWTRTWGVTEKVLKVTKQTYQIVCCPQGTRALSKVAQSVTRLHSSPVVLLSCRKRPWVSNYWCDFFFSCGLFVPHESLHDACNWLSFLSLYLNTKLASWRTNFSSVVSSG